MEYLCVLGRQPAIGRAELEALYGADHIEITSTSTVIVKTTKKFDITQLGGTVKVAKILTRLPRSSMRDAFTYLSSTIPAHLSYLPDGKLQFGISVYDETITPKTILAELLTLKKVIKKAGRSVRIIENKTPALDAAQVIYNKLTSALGWELLLIKSSDDILLAQTTAVQDINDYTKRDRMRPKRDARVGMLPPKLAQTIINLARDRIEIQQILDPFCGTGVILQEALLMGYDVAGTDVQDRMIDYSKQNLAWLQTQYSTDSTYTLERGDATAHQWDYLQPHKKTLNTVVASEIYLGRPFTAPPDQTLLHKNRADCDIIFKKFLENLAAQLPHKSRLCLAVPAWHVNQQIYHLKTLDDLEKIGYNRISFVHASQNDLIYHREGQIVGRELIVLTRR